MKGQIGDRSKLKVLMHILVITIIIFSVFMYAYLGYISGLLEEETRGYLRDISVQRTAAFSTKVNSRLDALVDISEGIVSSRNTSIEDRLKWLGNKEKKKDYLRLGISDIKGNYKSTDGYIFGISEEKGFKRSIKGEVYVSEPFYDKATGAKIVVFYIPIKEDGKVVGVLTASKEIDAFAKVLFEPFFGGQGHCFIVNKQGEVLLHDNGKQNITNLNQLVLADDEGIIEDKVNYDDIAEGQGSIKVIHNKEELYAVYTHIGSISDWVLINTVPKSVVDEKKSIVFNTGMVMSSIVVFVFTVLIIYIFTSYKRNQAIYKHLAYVDRITGIGNHYGFLRDSEEFLKKKTGKFAMIYFDINNFKVTNNMFGHKFGDEILKNIAEILRQMFGENNVYARFSNDLFGVLMRISSDKLKGEYLAKYDFNHIIGHERDLGDIEYTNLDMYLMDVVAEIEHRIKNFAIETKPHVDLLMSYGVYVIKDSKEDISTIIDKANMARKTIKGQYQRRLAFFSDSIREGLVSEKNLEGEIIKAIREDEFEVYYQPKYRLSTGDIVGAEALIRWNHPESGIISPGKFIPVAEKTGLIIPIGRWVLDNVCNSMKEWEKQGFSLVPISVNFSKAEMYQTDFIESTKDTILRHGVDPKLIEIELTESAALDDIDFAKNTIMGFKSFGIKVSIDDFGTGYSCLSYLKSMPIDILKIDRSFITDIEENDKSKNVLKAIIGLAKSLNLDVISEGVETDNQTEFLKKVGCDMVQGFAFSRPIPVKEFKNLIEKQ